MSTVWDFNQEGKCLSCGGTLRNPQHGGLLWVFCYHCFEALSDEQRATYFSAMMHVYSAPQGQFNFYSRQLGMVVEDLTKVARR